MHLPFQSDRRGGAGCGTEAYAEAPSNILFSPNGEVVRDVVPKRMLKRLQTWAFDKMNGGLSDESAGAKTRAQRFAAGVPGIIADDREIGYSSRARKRFSVTAGQNRSSGQRAQA